MKKSKKTLKIWNGRGHRKYKNGHIYVAAYSEKQAAELVGLACGLGGAISASEIKNYFSKGCWGNAMDGIIPTEPCVYVTENYSDKSPIKII